MRSGHGPFLHGSIPIENDRGEGGGIQDRKKSDGGAGGSVFEGEGEMRKRKEWKDQRIM